VTSRPLEATASVSNRFFPKTRSWWALGAPINLMSPLSLLRVVYALMATIWPLVTLGLGAPRSGRVVLFAATALAAGIWFILLRVGQVSSRWCQILTVAAALATGGVVWAGQASTQSVSYLLLAAPFGVFAALFIGARVLVAQELIVAAAVWVGFEGRLGAEHTVFLIVVVVLVWSCVIWPFALLGRSARSHDAVDADTGLPNGFGLAVRLAARPADSYVVAVTSFAGLPEAREAFGYQAGTELLRRAVEDLGQVVPRDAEIGRVEGDEVVVIIRLPENDDFGDRALIDATEAAGRLAATLVAGIGAGHYLVDAVEVTLAAHVGVAIAPWDGADLAEVIRRASLSARRVNAGNRAYRIWDADHGYLTSDDLALLADLRLAGARGELWLAYQPQLAPATGRIESVEALLRWKSTAHGLVSPGRFVPLAERTGLIGRLTEWVLAEALDAQQRWRLAGLTLPVSVNLSATLLVRPDLAEWVQQELQSRSLPPSALTLEVTETAATTDLLQAVVLLGPLHDGGVRISIDDFGTGYTSLAALPYLPLDELKVDQSFVRRMATSEIDDAVVRTVIELAHRLGLAAVAEGVEDATCAQRLTDYGIDLLQGYHIAKPLAEKDLVALATADRDRSEGRTEPGSGYGSPGPSPDSAVGQKI
jgi:EAL domain-containing protein (putative c-di-GMP-specific phosphodiesterase class I)/GGDEF domain-containing protein